MPTRRPAVVALAVLMAISTSALHALAQSRSPAGQSKSSRAKALTGKLADTALTSAASLGADSLLGSKASVVAQAASGGGTTPCAAASGPAAALASMPAMPSAGGLLVSAAKKKLRGRGKATPDTAAASADSVAPCPTAAGTGSSALRTAGSVAMAASPAGLAVTAGVAAAPHAGKAIRSLRGRLRGGESAESMRKALEKGRLEVRGISFAAGSAEPTGGVEAAVTQLASALQGVEGTFVLYVTPEAIGDAAPDVATARRRATAIVGRLRAAGVDAATLGVGAARDAAAPAASRPGESRVVLVRCW
ncbi:MAG TPA: hypothetical protein VEA99_21300 [Gemmatimonadaceae bacterium]|nr:hypothetical protein [Gemmatimonadaceae bacterium]